jgi:hypothetical protein
MIVKYLDDGWNYIDHVIKVKNESIVVEELVRQFDEEVKEGKRVVLETINVKSDISTKVYLQIRKHLYDDCGYYNIDILDLLSPTFIESVSAALVYIFTDNNVTALLTNQSTYLMNDSGKTIEKLV